MSVEEVAESVSGAETTNNCIYNKYLNKHHEHLSFV